MYGSLKGDVVGRRKKRSLGGTGRAWLAYLMSLALPFAFIDSVPGIVPYMTVYECVALIGVIWTLLTSPRKIRELFSDRLNWVFFAFAYCALVSVLRSTDHAYSALRDYRHLFLSSLMVYIAFQLLVDDERQILFCFACLFAPLFIQMGVVFPHFFVTLHRPKDLPLLMKLVTLSTIAAWAVSYFTILLFRRRIRLLKKVAFALLLGSFSVLLYATLTRAILLGTLVTLPASYFICKSRKLKTAFVVGVLLFLTAFYMFLFFAEGGNASFAIIGEMKNPKIEHTAARYWDLSTIVADLRGRFYLWERAFKKGMHNFFLGSGLAAYRGFEVSTPHNAFVSIFLVSGILGLTFFISMITIAFKVLLQTSPTGGDTALKQFVFNCLVILVFSLFSNDFSGGRYALFGLLIAASSKIDKLHRLAGKNVTSVSKSGLPELRYNSAPVAGLSHNTHHPDG